MIGDVGIYDWSSCSDLLNLLNNLETIISALQHVTRYTSQVSFWQSLRRCPSAQGRWWWSSSLPRWSWESGGIWAGEPRGCRWSSRWPPSRRSWPSALPQQRWPGTVLSDFTRNERPSLNLSSRLPGSLGLRRHGSLELDWEAGVFSEELTNNSGQLKLCLHFNSLHFDTPGHSRLIQDNQN